MLCGVLCGFIAFSVTLPAGAVAFDLTKANPDWAMSISTTVPPPPVELPPVELPPVAGVLVAGSWVDGGALDELLLLPPPQPAATPTASTAAARPMVNLVVVISDTPHEESAACIEYPGCKDSVCWRGWPGRLIA